MNTCEAHSKSTFERGLYCLKADEYLLNTAHTHLAFPAHVGQPPTIGQQSQVLTF